MVNCMLKSKGKKRILPILYEAEIDDVKLISPLYRWARDRHKTRVGDDQVKSWEQDLKKISHAKVLDLKTNR